MTFPEVGHSFEAGDDDHDTPAEFFAPIASAVGGFDLDPAASASSELAARNVTEDEDGLSLPWEGKVWLNPPYSEVADWLQYGRTQFNHGNTELLVALVFARTSTDWWHDHATTADLRCFVNGRLTFGEATNSAPAPSVVCVWGDTPPALRRFFEAAGEVIA